jgi:hypothetical protein
MTWLEKLERHMKENEGQLLLSWNDKEMAAAYTFGREADDSDMAAGASYGYGSGIGEAMSVIIRELRLGNGDEKPA